MQTKTLRDLIEAVYRAALDHSDEVEDKKPGWADQAQEIADKVGDALSAANQLAESGGAI